MKNYLTLLYVSSNLSIFVQDKFEMAISIKTDSPNFTRLHYKTAFRQKYLLNNEIRYVIALLAWHVIMFI